jgi:hypothetical protein
LGTGTLDPLYSRVNLDRTKDKVRSFESKFLFRTPLPFYGGTITFKITVSLLRASSRQEKQRNIDRSYEKPILGFYGTLIKKTR